jgi:hypothetical protein
VPDTPAKLPDFVSWPSFPFEGELRVKPLEPVADSEPPRQGEDAGSCLACSAPDEAYIWVSERWRVRAMDRPTGLPMVLILESRSHLDLGDLPNLLAAELGVMTVRLERAIRSLDGVARVHVNRWGDGSAHLHLWFLARPTGRLQLRGSFLSLWDEILPPIPEPQWRENLALVAAWLAEFGGRPLAEPPRIEWQAPATLLIQSEAAAAEAAESAASSAASVLADGAPPLEDAAPFTGTGRDGEAVQSSGTAPSDQAGVGAGSEGREPARVEGRVDEMRTFVGTAAVDSAAGGGRVAPGYGRAPGTAAGGEAVNLSAPEGTSSGARPAASSAAS